MRYKSLTSKHVSVNFDPNSTAAKLLCQLGYVAAPELSNDDEAFYRPEDEIEIAHDEPVATDPNASTPQNVAPAQETDHTDNLFALPSALNQPTIAPDDAAVVNAPATDDTDDGTQISGRHSGKGLKTTRGK